MEKVGEDFRVVTLETINNGAAQDLFTEEFDKVMRNINDPSVDAEGVREIHLIFKFHPSEDRRSVATKVQAKTKLAPISAHKGSMFVSGLKAYTTNPHQQSFNFESKEQ